MNVPKSLRCLVVQNNITSRILEEWMNDEILLYGTESTIFMQPSESKFFPTSCLSPFLCLLVYIILGLNALTFAGKFIH